MSCSLLLVLACLAAASKGQNIFCIGQGEEAILDGRCFEVYSTSDSSTITFDASNSEIHFTSSDITFSNAIVQISNSINFTIGSSAQKTTIRCSGNSGFYLKNVSDACIVNVKLIGCGQELLLGHKHLVIVAVLIENCFDVALENVDFINSSGSGLIMLNIGGNSALHGCSFRNSTSTSIGSNKTITETGALHIQIATTCKKDGIKKSLVQCPNLRIIHNSTLTISECDFSENDRAVLKMRGGGLFLEIFGNSSGNEITIVSCTFSRNHARGGGAYIRLKHRISNNSIHFRNTSFISNQSPNAAGAVLIVYIFYKNDLPSNNKVVFSHCKFYDNKANYSGGVGIYSSSSQDESITENSIEFRDCVWINNSVSLIGAALGASPVYNNIEDSSNHNVISNKLWFIRVLLKDANISKNYFDAFSSLRSGIVYATIPVWFAGRILFHGNNGTALDIVSTTANFEMGSEVKFKDNNASQDGSALNLIGLSAITVIDNSTFTFRNNRACAGAAIQYHSIHPHDFVYSSLCFVRYAGNDSKSIEKRNINFVFDKNFATCKGFGNSIHTSTLHSCNMAKCKFSRSGIHNCVANFRFSDEKSTEITTDPIKIVLLQEIQTFHYPGKKFSLNIHLKDELNNTVPGIYHVTVASGDIKLDLAYRYIDNHEIRLTGRPGTKGTLNVKARSFLHNNVETYVAIILQQCPPGYVLDMKKNVCICSILIANKLQQYQCVNECNESLYMAVLLQNWWINFALGNDMANYDEHKLLYGYCPKNHCFNSEAGRLLYKNNTSQTIDDEIMCHPTRTGRLCSQCREPYTLHYHSNSYKCGTKTTCKYGWLLYLISEILPVTCLFIIISLFDIKLTSGVVSGFIYFAQTIDKVLLDESGSYFGSSKFTKASLHLYSLIIRIFNLKFIQFDSTSYCLLESANTLDMIAFQYTTALYSLVLVALIIATAHYCNRSLFVDTLKKLQKPRVSARSTLLHGVSGFLILSYSGITSTSVNLLLTVSLYSIGHKTNITAVYYNGEITRLSRGHLPYAIPAILILITIGLLPPMLLIAYPSGYRLLSLLKLNESKFSQILCTLIPLEKMKPLFDSFQSSFKDEYRFFSGLYFIFRLSTLAIQAVIPASGSTLSFYAAISIQSALILGVQVVCQPFKKRLHNILESVFLLDLTAIAITFATVSIHTYNTTSTIIAFQLILLYLPLVIMAVYAGKAVWNQIKASQRCAKRKEDEDNEYHEFNDSILLHASENRGN